VGHNSIDVLVSDYPKAAGCLSKDAKSRGKVANLPIGNLREIPEKSPKDATIFEECQYLQLHVG